MKTLIYIIFLLCLFQITTYAQETAQVTLSIRLHPIQTIEVVPSDIQKLELFNENDTNISPSCHLSTFSTSNHTTRVDFVRSKGFEALRAVRELPPHADKSINHIFSDESNYYKNNDEYDEGLNLLYSMETL